MKTDCTYLFWSADGRQFVQDVASIGGGYCRIRKCMGPPDNFWEADIVNPNFSFSYDYIKTLMYLGIPSRYHGAHLLWIRK